LNARSQALKILANTFYGALGYARFRWYNRSCAEAVTAWGREHIKDTIKSAEDAGFEVIYGDSLPYGRYIFVKNPSGILDHIKIGDFVRKNKNNPNLNKFKTIAYDGSKLIFKPILRAIEHSYDSDKKGKLMEFVTNKGKTIVTPQHSVYYFNEKNKKIELIDAKNLRIGDKLISLTNPKLPEIYKNNHKIDILDLDLGNQKDELRVYADNLKFPYGKKGKCPYCGKERTLYSRISVEHSDRKISLEKAKKTNYGFIGGKNAKIGRIPRFWRLNEELAWIMGYYCADGSASEKNNVHNKQLVSFGSQNKKTIEKVRKYFDGILGEKLKIIKDFDKRINKNMYYYRIQRAPLVALFKYGFRLGNKSYGKRVSPLIFSAENKIKEEFLKGYLEGDGNKFVERRYRTHFIDISTKSHELAIGLQVLLKSMKHSKNYFGKKMEHIHWNYRKDKPGIVDLRLQGVRSKNEEFSNFCLAEIKKINKINEKDTVFDLEVEGLHNFVDAEGLILVHNTDSVFLLMGKRKKKDAEEFIEKINSKLPGKMELELEGYYPRGVFVDKKGGGTRGAKKKYALIAEDGSYKIKGFELVRRDWSKIAKDTQKKVLEAILKEGSKEKAAKIVKDVVEKLKKGKVPFEELVIYTQINKDPKSYDIKSPELSAAKKAIAKGVPIEKGSMIAFVIGKKGDSISDKATPLDFAKDYDADYYINRQILPSVMKILKELGYSEDDLKLGGKQKGLGEFF